MGIFNLGDDVDDAIDEVQAYAGQIRTAVAELDRRIAALRAADQGVADLKRQNLLRVLIADMFTKELHDAPGELRVKVLANEWNGVAAQEFTQSYEKLAKNLTQACAGNIEQTRKFRAQLDDSTLKLVRVTQLILQRLEELASQRTGYLKDLDAASARVTQLRELKDSIPFFLK